jgi:acetyl-CoA C-acetyltransferase
MPTSPVPALIGAGQVTDRPDDPSRGLEPLALMETAARRAADDAGGGAALLRAVDTVAVVTNVFHDYGDTAAMLAERLDCAAGPRLLSTWGGNTPQTLLAHLCDEIVAGRSRVALMAGGEAFQTMRALGKLGKTADWTAARPGVARIGDTRDGSSPLESAHGARQAYVTYALVENAFRAARGLSLARHRDELGAYCARSAAIAAANPYAWFRDGKDAATITTVNPRNRMVAFPYPKLMNAIMEVNQGAALLVTSADEARRLGIAADRLVYPWSAADVTEVWHLTERPALHEIPGMRAAGAALLRSVGLGIDDITHLDLYSCFPIASRLSAEALGLAPDTTRPLTVTGGLPWFGGPGNDYATHAIAAIVERLRTDRRATALVHALGWNFTKHALGVYGGEPPPHGWQRVDTRAIEQAVDGAPRPALASEPAGAGTLETYTIVHGRDGAPTAGVAVGRLDDDRRFVATLPDDAGVLAAAETAEQVGVRGRVTTRDGRARFEFA